MPEKLPFPCGVYDFIHGDEAIARAAIMAGCRFFAGYPITPASEILEVMSLLMPLVDGVIIQMEDELASLAAAIGASWAGVKSMTATSSPGFTLMLENLGYAIMTETPVVVVNVQRSGPSTGQPTMPSQGDILQAIWGVHGDHSLIVLSPSTVEEAFNMTIRAFNLAERYRVPVVLLTDGEIGHLREKVYIPFPEEVVIESRKTPKSNELKAPFKDWHGDGIPPMPVFGRGYRVHVTGLTHDEKGYPETTNPLVHERLVKRLVEKIERNVREIFTYKQILADDAKVLMVAHGITARVSIEALEHLRKKGIRAGLLKLDVLWPLDFALLEQVVNSVERIVVPEMNLGQLYHLIKEIASPSVEVVLVSRLGGEIPTPTDIVEAVLK
uniref:2-oxoacid oxidoreductase (ferredoxin) n=1 Tax=Fervidicoccus fontis TaxID=683846 RepID=A0A7J3ZLV1_9CREN